MVEFLRRHSLVTLLISVILIAAGSWAVLFQDPDDVSDTAMFLLYSGFIASCIGFVGLMIIIFRPVAFSKDDAAQWELARLGGKPWFVLKVLVWALPFLVGVVVAIWETADLVSLALVFSLFLGLSVLGAHALWEFFQRQHTAVTSYATEDGTEKQPQEPVTPMLDAGRPSGEISDVKSDRETSSVDRKRP